MELVIGEEPVHADVLLLARDGAGDGDVSVFTDAIEGIGHSGISFQGEI